MQFWTTLKVNLRSYDKMSTPLLYFVYFRKILWMGVANADAHGPRPEMQFLK